MKRQNIVVMLFLAVLLVAGTAESRQLGNERQTVVLECGVLPPDDSTMPPPGQEVVSIPQVIAVSVTSGAPAINKGDPCATAIGELINTRFNLVSATSSSVQTSGGPAISIEVSTVQYLFVSKPGSGDHEYDD